MHSKPTCYPKKVTVLLVAGLQSCALDIHVVQSNHTNNGNVKAKKIAWIVINLEIKICGVLFCFSRLIWLSWWVIKLISFFVKDLKFFYLLEKGAIRVFRRYPSPVVYLLNTVYRGIYGHDCHCVIACFVKYGWGFRWNLHLRSCLFHLLWQTICLVFFTRKPFYHCSVGWPLTFCPPTTQFLSFK